MTSQQNSSSSFLRQPAFLLALALLAAGRVAADQPSTPPPLGIGEVDIDCAEDKTVPWGAEWEFDKPKVRDFSSDGSPVSVHTVYTKTNLLCGRSYQVSRKWEATDGQGFNDSCKQVVTVLDVTAPVLTAPPGKTVECGDAWSFDTPAAFNALDGSALVVAVVSVSTNHFAFGLLTATCVWEATDACGGQAQCSQTVSIVDTRPPLLVCGPDSTVDYGTAWGFEVPTAFDDCSGGVVAIEVAGTETNSLCGRTFTATRTWVATDAAGHTVMRSQAITVRDEQPPVLYCATDKSVEAGTPWNFDAPSAFDEYDGADVTLSIASTTTNMLAGGMPVVTRIWRASDLCGNAATCSQSVTVRDTQAPALPVPPAGRTYQCFADVPAPAMLLGDDACDGRLVTSCVTTTNGSCPTRIIHTWIATDASGNTAAVSQTNLVFVEAPRVVSAPADQLVCLGQRVMLSLELASACAVSFEWSKDGQRVEGATGSSLTLESISTGDAGSYCVRVRGDFCPGADALVRCFNLTVRPELAAPPLADQVACAGEPAVFSAPTGGVGPFRYSWRKNGSPVSGETNDFLVVAAAGAASVGTYTVEITGPCSSQTASGALMLRPPTDAAPLASLTRNTGESATFATTVTGPAPLARLWRRNGTVIPGATSDSFTIPSVAAADGGTYSVEIIGACQSVTRSATLTVAATPPPPPPANTAPYISPVADFILEHNCRTGEVPFMVSDAETPSRELVVTASSSDPMLLPPAYIILDGTGADRRATVVAPSAGTGSVNVTLTVSDGQASSSMTFKVTIRPAAPARSRLLIIIHGDGQVVPDLNGQELVIGQSYTVRATPGAGQMFTGWEAGASGDRQALTFVMMRNLVLDASFAPNPFLKLASTYNGLFHESDEIRQTTSGAFTLTMNNQGRYSGIVQIGASRFRLSGKFDLHGNATNSIRRVRNSPLAVELHIGLDENPAQISGVVKDGVWSAALLADRASFHARTNLAPFAGRYTMVIPGGGDGSVAPAGDGFASLVVTPGGLVTIAAVLPDGSRAVRRVPVTKSGEWPLYVALHGGRGSLLSWQTFANRPADDVHGVMSWIRPALPTAARYASGFALDVEAVGSRYQAPARGSQVLNIGEGVVSFSGGGAGFANAVTLMPDNRVINHSENRLNLAIVLPSGLFRGTVFDPVTFKPMPFSGALLQKQNRGAGYCPGAGHDGRVTFEAAPQE